jgi:hypothetical protein
MWAGGEQQSTLEQHCTHSKRAWDSYYQLQPASRHTCCTKQKACQLPRSEEKTAWLRFEKKDQPTIRI